MSITVCLSLMALAPIPMIAGQGQESNIGMRAGQIHPDFELPNLDGDLVKLSSYAGRKIVLIHFASW